MIIIKPHHLIDIIKLYGSGIEHFLPDESYQHDFYKIANIIIEDLNCQLQFTIYGDDICKPCKKFQNSLCIDPLNKVKGYDSKNSYNQELDLRLISQLQIDINTAYTVCHFIEILNNNKDIIFHVWLEEDDELTKKRDDLFQKGLKKMLNN